MRVWTSEDSGATWTATTDNRALDRATALSVHPRNSNLAWTDCYYGVLMPGDFGQRWRLSNNGLWSASVHTIEANPRAPQ